MLNRFTFALALIGLAATGHAGTALRQNRASKLASTFAEAIEKVNQAHARNPAARTEADLSRKLAPAATSALEKLIRLDPSPDTAKALVRCGEAALDLDRMGDFERIRERLLEISNESALELGVALSHPRFLLRGLGGLSQTYLKGFADMLDAVLESYDEVFGFAEWSKLPGKKLRVRIHLEEKITRPPHFAPQFPYHSEIDFPVSDPDELASPTPDGKFLFYGICHELGHVIAMWGDRRNEEDHHTWAHYTGVAIVEHVSRKHAMSPFMKKLRDGRARSLQALRESVKDTKPSLDNRDGVLALLVQLHDRVGSKAIGKAINDMDRKSIGPRINRVRYYGFKDFEAALLRTAKGKKKASAVKKIFKGL